MGLAWLGLAWLTVPTGRYVAYLVHWSMVSRVRHEGSGTTITVQSNGQDTFITFGGDRLRWREHLDLFLSAHNHNLWIDNSFKTPLLANNIMSASTSRYYPASKKDYSRALQPSAAPEAGAALDHRDNRGGRYYPGRRLSSSTLSDDTTLTLVTMAVPLQNQGRQERIGLAVAKKVAKFYSLDGPWCHQSGPKESNPRDHFWMQMNTETC